MMTASPSRHYSGYHKAAEEQSNPEIPGKGLCGERNVDSGHQVQLEEDRDGSTGQIWMKISALWQGCPQDVKSPDRDETETFHFFKLSRPRRDRDVQPSRPRRDDTFQKRLETASRPRRSRPRLHPVPDYIPAKLFFFQHVALMMALLPLLTGKSLNNDHRQPGSTI